MTSKFKKYVRPPFPRIGNKKHMLNIILKYMPDHTKYIEGFVGSGFMFFNKPIRPSILNDLDTNVVERLELLKKAPLEGYKKDFTLNESKRFFNTTPRTIQDKLLWHKVKSTSGFQSKDVEKSKQIYRSSSHTNTLVKNIPLYKQLLKDATITHLDYKKLRRYDSPTSFFFLDPPYENTFNGSYNEKETGATTFDFESFKDWCNSLKGFVMITLNDSKTIRELFKDWIIVPHKTYGEMTNAMRKELIIMNYTLPQ